eukprot:g3121.t1
MVGGKVEALLSQVSAQLIALNSDKKLEGLVTAEDPELLDLKPSEPAAEPESSVPSASASKDRNPAARVGATLLCQEESAEAPHAGAEPWAAAFAPTAESWAAFPPETTSSGEAAAQAVCFVDEKRAPHGYEQI